NQSRFSIRIPHGNSSFTAHSHPYSTSVVLIAELKVWLFVGRKSQHATGPPLGIDKLELLCLDDRFDRLTRLLRDVELSADPRSPQSAKRPCKQAGYHHPIPLPRHAIASFEKIVFSRRLALLCGLSRSRLVAVDP